MEQLILLAGMGAIFYFLLIRPQQQQAKKHKEMLESLQKGDKIVTNGGLIVDIVKIEENFFKIKLDDKCEARLSKDAIARKFSDDA